MNCVRVSAVNQDGRAPAILGFRPQPRRIQFGARLCESQQPLDLGRAASRAPHTAANYFFCQARTNGRQILLLNASTAWFNVRTDNEKGSI